MKMAVLEIQGFIFCLALIITFSFTEEAKLSDYILDFQPVTYDTVDLHVKHERVRRAVEPHLQLKFEAYGRTFHLWLQKDSSIFGDEHMMKESDGTLTPVDTSFIYTGHLEDTPGSSAHISVINGTARGFVHIPGHTTFHIEPANIYFKNPGFHTVIYPESHMDLDPYRHRRSAEVGVCGNDWAAEWMKSQAESVIDDVPSHRAKRYSNKEQGPHNKYSANSNKDQGRRGGREKRSTIGPKNTCYLYLRADPILWEHVKNKKYNMQLTDSRTQEEILAFFASHVSALKNIYSKTKFRTYDGTMEYEDLDFVVQRTSIMTLENQKCNSHTASSYCSRNIDVTNFLNLNSLDQHDEFCLAYVFTFRDFTKGTLGLAWVGSDSRAAGGVCERHKDYPEGGNRVSKSLNTGIVTVINYGKAVPARVSQLTFAHEIGHNFGSPHDSGPSCAPYGTKQKEAEDGNYIMFASATMGDKANNDDFSICSLDNVTRVLDAVINQRYGKINCLQKSTEAFCGNSITEAGEECDCGYSADCQDQCCYGKGSSQGQECTLKDGKQCSPTAGPCCSPECEYIPQGEAMVCTPQDDCKAQSLWNSAQCPGAQQKDNGTFCNDFSQICNSGECVKSVCHRIKWEECFLTSTEEKGGPSREAMCYVSCRNPITKQCISSYTMAHINHADNLQFKDLLSLIQGLQSPADPAALLKGFYASHPHTPLTGIQLPAGSPCNNFKGYCDVFHKCRGVDADGPLARLKNLIFDPKTLQSIKDWIVVHWWAVMLMSTGLILVMAVFIKVCAVHTPSSNPRKPKARKLTMTLRRPHRGHGRSQSTTALTANQHRSGGGGRNGRSGGGGGGGGSGGSRGQGSERPTTEGSRSGQGQNKPVGAAVAGGGGASAAGSSGGAGDAGAGGGDGARGGAAAVVVEKFREPPPPYTSALLPGNSKLPPHGKGKRGKRQERGVELQRL